MSGITQDDLLIDVAAIRCALNLLLLNMMADEQCPYRDVAIECKQILEGQKPYTDEDDGDE